jgi:hypothetical protein
MTFVHNIGFKNPVNISIYQKLEEKYRSRQKIEGEYLFRQRVLCTEPHCVINDDNYTLTIKLSDPFNLPNALYSVEFDDDFLIYKSEDKAVPGIKLGKWMINKSKGISS